MYSHQVIESLKTISQSQLYDEDMVDIGSFLFKNIVPKIRECEKIHLGDLGDLTSFFKNKITDKTEAFKGYFSGVRLPFKSCWIDFSCPIQRLFSKDSLLGQAPFNTTKRGMYCEEIFEDVISVHFFNYLHELKRWEFSPIEVFISTNNIPLNTHPGFTKYLEPLNDPKDFTFDLILNYDYTIIARYLEDKKTLCSNSGCNDDVYLFRTTKNIIPSIFGINLGLSLLQCKNIATVKGENLDRLNKKRIKNNKEPSYVFNTLMVKPLRYLNELKKEVVNKGMIKLHVAMGHFKVYTEDKPLFGKYSGKFWWQDQVRGNIKNGMVVKDYHLLTE